MNSLALAFASLEHQIGYARYSQREGFPCFDEQRSDLRAAGCEEVFGERVYAFAERKQLLKALDRVRSGGALTVTSLDRLGGSAQEATDIMERLEARGAGLRILSFNQQATVSASRMTSQLIAAAVEVENTVRLDRQHKADAKSRIEAGVTAIRRKIRRYQLILASVDQVKAMLASGMREDQIARKLCVGYMTVQDAKRELRFREEGEVGLERHIAHLERYLEVLAKKSAAVSVNGIASNSRRSTGQSEHVVFGDIRRRVAQSRQPTR
jgi:DNA invertase Pin-like site-specific DNA recombinase